MENNYREFWLEFGRGRWTATYTEKVDGLNEDAIHVVEYAALESANVDMIKYKELYEEYSAEVDELQLVRRNLESENKKLSEQLSSANAEISRLQTEWQSMRNELRDKLYGNGLAIENARLREKLTVFEGMTFSENEEIAKLRAALNRIGMLGASEHAYTSEFTTKVVGIVREALK